MCIVTSHQLCAHNLSKDERSNIRFYSLDIIYNPGNEISQCKEISLIKADNDNEDYRYDI